MAPLTVPGGGRVGAWAISSVTVAPTHRRRGIARALLGSELRTAHALGVPLAILTVSESVIYGRWGFGPATYTTAWSIDTKRVRWAGAETPGRLSFTDPEDYRETGEAVLEAMAARAGEIGLEPYLAHRLIGPLKGDPDADKYRLVRYDSPTGEPEGFVSYTVKGDDDFTRHTIEVGYLAAATDEALTALWRFLLELDLVATVKVWTRGVDEPLPALVSDIRGAKVTDVQDHLWVRILDVPAALQARTYERDGSPGARRARRSRARGRPLPSDGARRPGRGGGDGGCARRDAAGRLAGRGLPRTRRRARPRHRGPDRGRRGCARPAVPHGGAPAAQHLVLAAHPTPRPRGRAGARPRPAPSCRVVTSCRNSARIRAPSHHSIGRTQSIRS
ncbi:GNAT family N-acetyltransferase [Leifsonia sp. L25]|uniref:GNAT family N-acetyltransferase n=1 Tax=Leifsonia sp. L25 TaxID=3423957 RepID=UPI003D69A0F9